MFEAQMEREPEILDQPVCYGIFLRSLYFGEIGRRDVGQVEPPDAASS
jgi:hypothetical protein